MQNDIASRVRQRLTDLNKSAASASLEAGLGRSAIQDILSGRVGNPRFDTLVKLAEALDCSVNYLTGMHDDPADGIRYSNLNEYSLFDAIPSYIYGVLAAGVFTEPGPDSDPVTPPTSAPRHLAYRDLRRPDLSVELWRQNDNSLAGIGILKGDILTATDMGSEEIALKPGRVVVVKRVIGMEGPLEMSARVVEIVNNTVRLVTKPTEGSVRSIVVASKRVEDGEELSNPNFYWVAGESESWIHVEAMVVRVTREVSFFD
jgi:transcriptional regulator with XRE-family HTH domain